MIGRPEEGGSQGHIVFERGATDSTGARDWAIRSFVSISTLYREYAAHDRLPAANRRRSATLFNARDGGP
jgi:hypothetical protein